MIDKGIMINAIVGRGFKSMDEADYYTRGGLAHYTGDQHNPEWSWDRVKLSELPMDVLQEIYCGDKK